MIKAVFVYERRQSELLPRLLEFLFSSKKGLKANGKEVFELIKKENPKLAFFEFENPSNVEGNFDRFLKSLDESILLHVSFIKVSPANFFLVKIVNDRISGFIKFLSRHQGNRHRMREAYGKR